MSNWFYDLTIDNYGGTGDTSSPFGLKDLFMGGGCSISAGDTLYFKNTGAIVPGSSAFTDLGATSLFQYAPWTLSVTMDKWSTAFPNGSDAAWRLRVDCNAGTSDAYKVSFRNGILSLTNTDGNARIGGTITQPENANFIFINEDGGSYNSTRIAGFNGGARFKGCTIIADTSFQTASGASSNVFQDCIFGHSNTSIDDAAAFFAFTRCAFVDNPSHGVNTTMTNCQTGWTPPVWPAWNAATTSWQDTTIAIGITSPPEPGSIPYTGYETDPWGNVRSGIGAMYMTIVPTTTTLAPTTTTTTTLAPATTTTTTTLAPPTTTTTAAPAIVLYVNAGSTGLPRNGSTINQGFHTLTESIGSLVDGAILDVVDNGIVDDSFTAVVVPNNITIRSNSGNSKNPIVSLVAADGGISMAAEKWIKCHNINFTVNGNFSTVLMSDPAQSGIEFDRCEFDKVYIKFDNNETHNDTQFSVTNCIFHSDYNANNGAVEMHGPNSFTPFVCNNTMYNFNYALAIFSPLTGGRIYNNIFLNQFNYCIYSNSSSTFPLIDYNQTFGYGLGEFLLGGGFLGSNNVSNVNPSLNGVLYPTGTNLNVGINHASEPAVPTHDFLGNSRPQAVQTTLGAYEYGALVPTTTTTLAPPTTTTTLAPTTTTTTLTPATTTTTTTLAPATTTTTLAPATTTTTLAPATTTTTLAPATTTTLAPTTTTTASPIAPPVNSVGYPLVNTNQETTVNVVSKIDRVGTVYFVIVSKNSVAPTSIQVKAGQDSTGHAVLAGRSGNHSATALVEVSIPASNLTAGTTYDAYVVAENSNHNLQLQPVLVQFETIPAITGQRSTPRVYVGDYITINLNGLIVMTDKSYPAEFTLSVQAGSGYNIISSTTVSAKLQISGDKSVGGLRLVPITISDGTFASHVFNYQITVITGQVQKGKPVGFSVGGIRRS